MTLITVGNSEGSRRCDEKCYDAKGPVCDCVCGGRNHGKGLAVAAEQTATIARRLVEECGGARVIAAALQKELFA